MGVGIRQARCHAVTAARGSFSDARSVEIPGWQGLRFLALGRSSRLAANSNARAFFVLEGVTLAGRVARLLADGDLVRWLS